MGYEPMKLKGERVWRTYVGGKMIDRLGGKEEGEDGHFPEEWMYSVTRAANAGREDIEEGICRLDDGSFRTLKEVIEGKPEEMLGASHVKRWGVTPGVLIKIIDSRERLTIQVHPDKEKAKELFHSPFGKTECWHILDTRKDMEEEACIYLGFKEGITRDMLEDCFEKQDYERMLSLLNRIPVKPGETYLVRGGIPHAIGAGCLLIEIQEPTDYTIRVERVTPSGFRIDDRMCHQGLGFKRMFECFNFTGENEERTKEKFRIRPRKLCRDGTEEFELVGYEDTPCFRMEKLTLEGDLKAKGEGVFSCLYVLSGKGILKTESCEYLFHKHDQFFVPAGAGEYRLSALAGHPAVLLRLYGPES